MQLKPFSLKIIIILLWSPRTNDVKKPFWAEYELRNNRIDVNGSSFTFIIKGWMPICGFGEPRNRVNGEGWEKEKATI